MDLVPYGWSDRWAARLALVEEDGVEPGRVVRHDGPSLLVATTNGVCRVQLSRRLDPEPAVGDWMALDGDVPITVLHRTALLRRWSADGTTEQPLAANVDVVLLVGGIDRPIKAGRIQRAAALAWDAGAQPVVVLTKVDLLSDAAVALADATADRPDVGRPHVEPRATGQPDIAPPDLDEIIDELVAAVPGLDVVTTSSASGTGLDQLRELIADRTVVLLGESGAGKSSLVNALLGDDVAAIGDVRSGDFKGRHTTTARQLHLLPDGGVVIDTPGIRSVGLWVAPEAVDQTFPDIDELGETCHFNDCRHDAEPGCAVLGAVDDGTLAAERLAEWRALRREAEAAALRATPHELRQHNKQFSRVAKDAMARKDH